jgi:hypothetical protein
MLYKPITWIINKDDFKKSSIISKQFVISPENKSILFGNVKLEDNTPAIAFGVILEEIDKVSNTVTNSFFSFTDENGNYYISFIPLDSKLYNIVVYRSLNLNNN